MLFKFHTVEIVTTAIGENKKIYKRSTSNFFVHLLDCLNKRKHGHMLRYVPNSDNKEFEVTFLNKHYSGWTENDISLFEDSDKYLEEIHGKERSPDSDDCKGRFRARMQKCFAKYVKFIKEEKDKEIKCKRVAKYKILHVPQYSYVEEISRNKRKLRRKSCGKEKEKSKKKEVNDKSSHEIAPLANMSLGGNYNMLPENVCQENNTKIILKDDLKEKDRKDSHFLCLISVSQSKEKEVNDKSSHEIAPLANMSLDGNYNMLPENVCQENSTKIILKDDLKEKDKKDPHFLCLLSVSQSNATAPTPTMNLNILNMWKAPNTLFRNLDANTNLVTLGGYAPSMVQTVGMETVIGNLDASINVPNVEMETVIGNLDASINLPNVGMETVIGNLDASINVPNVGMETVIGNLDASINVPNVGMKTVIENLDASINVPNVGMKTVIGNLDASINVPNVAMETVIGNLDANTNLVTLGGSAPNMDVTFQNVGMETETVIGNSGASINVPNVGMETAIGNLDANTNFVTHGGYAPRMALNVQNVGMETVIGNSDASINIPNVGMETVIGNSDASINIPNVGMETVIGNSDASINVPNVWMETVIEDLDDYTNFTFGGFAPTMDMAMETEAIIRNLDAGINVPNVWMGTVIENSDDDTNLDTLDSSFPSLDLNVKNLGMETVIGNSDAYTNMETLGGCFSSGDLNVQNMGMETVIENSDADAIDSIRKLDHWLCNFQPIC